METMTKKPTQEPYKTTKQHYKTGKTHMCRSLVHIIIQSGIPTTLVGVRLRIYLQKQHTRSVKPLHVSLYNNIISD